MASLPKNQSSLNAPQPIHDPANAPLLDYILQSAKTIQRTELTVGLLSWLVMGLATIFSFVLIDHWVWPFNDFLRYALWLVLVAGSFLWLMLRVVPLLGRSINPEYAAKRIEDTIPEMKDGLISWLQLASRETTPRGVLNTVGRYVAKHLQGQDVASVIDQFTSMKLAAMLFGLMLIIAIYIAASPKSGLATIGRLMMPWANIAPSTRVQILELSPGDATVTESSSLRIAIQVRGWHRGDTAQIRYATDDGQTVNETVGMRPEIEGLTYFTDFGKSFGGIVQPMHYFVEAGDAKAGPFAIRIQAVPLILLEEIEYNYPAYMRLTKHVTEGDGRIEAPEGTRVTIRARSNQPMKKVRIEFDTHPEKNAQFRVVTVDDVAIDNQSISAELLLELDAIKSNPTLLNYRIRSENERGEENAEPVVYPVKIIPDLAPEVQLASDFKDSIELPVNQKLDFEVRSSDPDFGLVRLAISGTSGDQTLLAKELFRNEAGINGQVTEIYTLDPQSLRLQPGTHFELAATAEDNRCAIGSDKPEPNVRQSRTIRVTIIPSNQNAPNAKAEKKDSEAPSEQTKPDKTASRNDDSKTARDTPSAKPEQGSKSQDKEPNDGTKSEVRPANDDSRQPNKGQEDKPNQSSKTDAPSPSGNNPEPSKPDQTQPDQTQPDQTQPDKTQPDKAQPDKAQPDKAQPDKAQPDKGLQQNDPSNAGESNQGQSGGEQTGGGGKQGSPPSKGAGGGDEPSSSPGTNSSNSDSGGKSSSSKGPAQSGEPMHDGEAFEELRELLQDKGGANASEGAVKSTNTKSTEKNDSRSSTSNEPSSGEGKPSNADSASSSSSSNDRQQGTTANPSKSDSSTSDKSSKTGQADPDSGKPGKDSQTDKNGSSGKQSTDDKQASGVESGPAKTNSDKVGDKNNPGKGNTEESEKGLQGNSNADKGKASDEGNPSSSKGEQGAPSEPSSSQGQKGEQGAPSEPSGSQGQKGEQGASKEPSSSQGQKGEQADGMQGTKSEGQNDSAGNQPSDSATGNESSNKGGKASKNSTGNRSGKNGLETDEVPGDATGNPIPPAESTAAETEYARQATDMVLKALDRQRDQPDSELLKKMGWNEEQMRAFLDRWKNARDQAANNPQKKREYDEALRSLGLIPSTGTAKSSKGHDDRMRGLKEEGSRVRPPESLRERFEAFRKSAMP